MQLFSGEDHDRCLDDEYVDDTVIIVTLVMSSVTPAIVILAITSIDFDIDSNFYRDNDDSICAKDDDCE